MLRDPALNKQRKGCMEQFWKKNVLELRKKEKKEGQNTIRGVGLDRQQLLRTTVLTCSTLHTCPFSKETVGVSSLCNACHV